MSAEGAGTSEDAILEEEMARRPASLAREQQAQRMYLLTGTALLAN